MNIKKILYYGATIMLIISFIICILLDSMIMNDYEKKLNNEVSAIHDHRPAQKVADTAVNIILLGTIVVTTFIRIINKKSVPKSKVYIADKIIYSILLVFLILALPITKYITSYLLYSIKK